MNMIWHHFHFFYRNIMKIGNVLRISFVSLTSAGVVNVAFRYLVVQRKLVKGGEITCRKKKICHI